MMKHMMCKIHFLRSEKADSHGSRVTSTQDVSLSFTGMWVAERSNTSLKSDIKYKYIFYVNIHEKRVLDQNQRLILPWCRLRLIFCIVLCLLRYTASLSLVCPLLYVDVVFDEQFFAVVVSEHVVVLGGSNRRN